MKAAVIGNDTRAFPGMEPTLWKTWKKLRRGLGRGTEL